MKCPVCSGKIKVLQHMVMPWNQVEQLRECPSCSYRDKIYKSTKVG